MAPATPPAALPAIAAMLADSRVRAGLDMDGATYARIPPSGPLSLGSSPPDGDESGMGHHTVVGPDALLGDVPGPEHDLDRLHLRVPGCLHGQHGGLGLIGGGQIATQQPPRRQNLGDSRPEPTRAPGDPARPVRSAPQWPVPPERPRDAGPGMRGPCRSTAPRWWWRSRGSRPVPRSSPRARRALRRGTARWSGPPIPSPPPGPRPRAPRPRRRGSAPTSFGYTSWAPRGILSTKSA